MEPINGDKLRQARELAGKTQLELAEDVGVSLRTVGNWERGGAVPRKHWVKVFRALPGLEAEAPHALTDRSLSEGGQMGDVVAGMEVHDLTAIHDDDLVALWSAHEFQANRAAREFARRRSVTHADAIYPLHLLARGEAKQAAELLEKARKAKVATEARLIKDWRAGETHA